MHSPLSQEHISAILKKTAQAAADGRYELFKTSAHFDSTATHPDWLGGETKEIKKLASGTAI